MRLSVQSMPALLVSLSIHAALVAVVVWAVYASRNTEANRSRREPGIVGSAASGNGGGVAPGIAAPLAGPSLDRADGIRYVGRYRRQDRHGNVSILYVDLVNDGESEPHWALTIAEGEGPVHKLSVIGRDTFAFQLAPKQRVIFQRMDDSVTATSVRRGRDTTWALRVASAPNRLIGVSLTIQCATRTTS